MEGLNLPNTFVRFNHTAQDYYGSMDSDSFERALERFPESIRNLLFNTGVTHFVMYGETEYVVDRQENSEFNEAGRYFDFCKCAVTEMSSHDVAGTNRHEAGHALSFALGSDNTILEPYAAALEEDLRNLTDEQWEILENSGIDFFENMAKGSNHGPHGSTDPRGIASIESDTGRYKFTDELLDTLKEADSELYNMLFPNFEESLGIDGFKAELAPIYDALSQHPRMIEAFKADLKALLEGKTHFLWPRDI